MPSKSSSPDEEANAVRATCNRALFVDERRKMMQAWADYLDAVQAVNVLPMHRKGA